MNLGEALDDASLSQQSAEKHSQRACLKWTDKLRPWEMSYSKRPCQKEKKRGVGSSHFLSVLIGNIRPYFPTSAHTIWQTPFGLRCPCEIPNGRINKFTAVCHLLSRMDVFCIRGESNKSQVHLLLSSSKHTRGGAGTKWSLLFHCYLHNTNNKGFLIDDADFDNKEKDQKNKCMNDELHVHEQESAAGISPNNELAFYTFGTLLRMSMSVF